MNLVMKQEAIHRQIKSFVKRTGRMTESQRLAIEQGGSYLLNETDTLSSKNLFESEMPLVLDIGFGNGEALAQQAKAYPEQGFVGVEVHTPGVGHLLQLCQAGDYRNLKIIERDGVEVIDQQIPDDSLTQVQVFFPDPWPKKRHHKRRLIQHHFLDLLLPKLKSGGLLHVATDWKPYAEHCLAIFKARKDLIGEGYVAQPEWRFESKFEQRGLKLGHGIFDLVYRKSQ